MKFKKDELSMKMSEYFKLIKPDYCYIQIIPDKSIRNYNTTNIAEAISYTYKKLSKRMDIEKQKMLKIIPVPSKITIEQNYHVAYIVDIVKNDVSFYFQFPNHFKTILLGKIREIWPKATINDVEGIKEFNIKSQCYQLAYKYEDALSLSVDKKSNEPLNSVLSVIDVMQDNDRLTIIYNFTARNQKGWKSSYKKTLDEVKAQKPVIKEKYSLEAIGKNAGLALISFLDNITDIIADFAGAKKKDGSLAEVLATALESSNTTTISTATKKKKDMRVLENQIAIVSYSEDDTRKKNNAIKAAQNYSAITDNNELIYKPVKNLPNLNDFKFKNYDVNTVSTDETQNFIQLPARSLFKQYNLNHIEASESMVPERLRKGYFCLGVSTFRGEKVEAYLEDEYNAGNFPLLLLGPQGVGKTTYMSNISRYANMRKEGMLILDYIKNCELSDSICEVIPETDRVVIDLSKETDIQGFGYNEIKITDDMTPYQILSQANLRSQYTINLIDAINVNEPLTSNMRTVLSACCNVVYASGGTSLKDVVLFLTNHNKRLERLNKLPKEIREGLDDELIDLANIDEVDKKTGEVTGTKISKTEFIMARISLLKEDFKLKFMYNKPTENNIDLVECMEQGKIVIIKMPQAEFPSTMVKNVLVTYWASKIWAATEVRGAMHLKPHRSHLIIDEPFQAPTVLKLLSYNMPQSRKYGLKTILSTQYLNQLGDSLEAIAGSNASFMLLKNTSKKDFEYFSHNTEMTYDDLNEMKIFHSLNLVAYDGGYSSFITKLPPEIKKG